MNVNTLEKMTNQKMGRQSFAVKFNFFQEHYGRSCGHPGIATENIEAFKTIP